MNITLLDGGLGQEINTRSTQDKSHPAWSVKVMLDEPEIVVDVHEAFIQAGARVLTLNNYTATSKRLRRDGMIDVYEKTHRIAIELMQQAVERSQVDRSQINIAGCLPPIGGSYDASHALDYTGSYDEYCRLIEMQINAVDVFLVETMSNITETRAAIDALASFEQHAYIGLTLSDDPHITPDTVQLRSGETLQDALEMLQEKQVQAVLLNCCFPETVTKAAPMLAASGLQWGGYANGFTSVAPLIPGTTVDNLSARTDLPPARYAEHVLDWLDAGAQIVGGCCEIGPDHIAYMHQLLCDKGYTPSKLV